MKRIALAVVLAAVQLSACDTETVLPAAPGATLDPIAFFTGRSAGSGLLEKVGSDPVRVTVDSIGRRRGDTLVLDQTIHEGTRAARVRRWTMRPAGPGRYTGTLTDASGPVSVHVDGPRASIAYTMKNGMKVHQQLALQADGRTVLNRLAVRKFGIALAGLSETIVKPAASRPN